MLPHRPRSVRLQMTLGLDAGSYMEIAKSFERTLRDALGLPWHNLRVKVVKVHAGSLVVVFDISVIGSKGPSDETPLAAALSSVPAVISRGP